MSHRRASREVISIADSSGDEIISISSTSAQPEPLRPPPRSTPLMIMIDDGFDDEDDDDDQIMEVYIPDVTESISFRNSKIGCSPRAADMASSSTAAPFSAVVGNKKRSRPGNKHSSLKSKKSNSQTPSKSKTKLDGSSSDENEMDTRATTCKRNERVVPARIASSNSQNQLFQPAYSNKSPPKHLQLKTPVRRLSNSGNDLSPTVYCPQCWKTFPSDIINYHIPNCAISETRTLEKRRAQAISTKELAHASALGRARRPDKMDDSGAEMRHRHKSTKHKSTRHSQQSRNRYHDSGQEEDGYSADDVKLPAKQPGKNNRKGSKSKNSNKSNLEEDEEFPEGLRKEVEAAIRQVRQVQKLSRKTTLRNALIAKNQLLQNAAHKSQPLRNYRRLPRMENGQFDSSYLRHEDYPLPQDSHHTIFIRKHFSSLAAEKDDDEEGGADRAPSPRTSEGTTDDSSADDDVSLEGLPPAHRRFFNKIKEFRIVDRIGVGYEEDELNSDIARVLELTKTTKFGLQKLYEYLAILLQVPVERVKAQVNGPGEPRRQHKTPYEDVMSSFRDLFCRRCLTFDCNLHGLQDDYPPDIQLELAIRLENSGYWKQYDDMPPMCLPVGTLSTAVPGEECSNDIENPDGVNVEPEEDRELSHEERELSKRLYQLFQNDLSKVALVIGVSRGCIRGQVKLENFEFRLTDPSPAMVSRSKHNKSNSYHPEWIKNIVQATSHPFFNPCTHREPCSEETCSCIQNRFFCTKACIWGASSRNFFRGCNCSSKCTNKSCPCFASNRECDPDLCKRCGACSDPPNRTATEQKCRNDNVGMRRHVHLVLGKSKVAGWGLFTKYALKKGDYVHEYLGELIPHNEAERRGQVYDDRNQTYIFDMSTDYAVDALKKGNKTRFINHSENPNIEPQMKVVNGDYRIGFFASKDIEAETELFFNYGDKFFKATRGFDLKNAVKRSDD